VHQGAAAFQLWTGKAPPLEVMFHAARDALAERARSTESSGSGDTGRSGDTGATNAGGA
jgi:hypothetical protein